MILMSRGRRDLLRGVLVLTLTLLLPEGLGRKRFRKSRPDDDPRRHHRGSENIAGTLSMEALKAKAISCTTLLEEVKWEWVDGEQFSAPLTEARLAMAEQAISDCEQAMSPSRV